MCKSDVDIRWLVGRPEGVNFWDCNIGVAAKIRLVKAVKCVGLSRKVSHSRMNSFGRVSWFKPETTRILRTNIGGDRDVTEVKPGNSGDHSCWRGQNRRCRKVTEVVPGLLGYSRSLHSRLKQEGVCRILMCASLMFTLDN